MRTRKSKNLEDAISDSDIAYTTDETVKTKSPSDMSFIGIRIPKELHTRLYRAKASLELASGKFYGMGRLMERVIRDGLVELEKSIGIAK